MYALLPFGHPLPLGLAFTNQARGVPFLPDIKYCKTAQRLHPCNILGNILGHMHLFPHLYPVHFTGPDQITLDIKGNTIGDAPGRGNIMGGGDGDCFGLANCMDNKLIIWPIMGSRPVVGSSNNKISGWSRARAKPHVFAYRLKYPLASLIKHVFQPDHCQHFLRLVLFG